MTPPLSLTNVTKLLDQINASLHQAYRDGAKSLFRNDETISRQGFLDILASVCNGREQPHVLGSLKKDLTGGGGGYKKKTLQYLEAHVESNDDVPTQSSQAKANAPSVDVMKYKCMEKKCRENGVEMTIPFCDRKNSILKVQVGYM